MKMQLVTIETDSWPLEGAYYEPDGEVRGAAVIFHGNVANFYVGPSRFLPPALTQLGLACLAFNRRGHDILGNHNAREPVGGAYQTIAQSLDDNDTAAEWLAERGHPAPIVIGHSNGGMLSVPFVARHKETPALVILSGHHGGRGFIRKSSGPGFFAGSPEHYDELRARAEKLVAEGKGDTLLLLPGWFYCMAAASLIDLSDNMPDMFEHAPNVTCPSLFIRGDLEPRDLYPAERFAEASGGPCDVEIVADCNHFYHGVERQVSELIARWLKKTLGL